MGKPSFVGHLISVGVEGDECSVVARVVLQPPEYGILYDNRACTTNLINKYQI